MLILFEHPLSPYAQKVKIALYEKGIPFEAKTPWEWATKHLTQAPTPIDAFPQGAALPQNKKNAIRRWSILKAASPS